MLSHTTTDPFYRKRKDVTELSAVADGVAVAVYAFDLLVLGEESLLDQPFSERRARLYEKFAEAEGFGFGHNTT